MPIKCAQDEDGGVGASYAAIWRQGGGPVCAGQLEIGRNGFRLDGADRSGTARAIKVAGGEITSLRIGRTPVDRIDGRSSLIVELSAGDRVMISSALGLGLTHEIAEQLSQLAEAGARA